MITINKMAKEIAEKYRTAYCLPIPEIQPTGGTKMLYTITGIGIHETRKTFSTRRLSWEDAYTRIFKLTQ